MVRVFYLDVIMSSLTGRKPGEYRSSLNTPEVKFALFGRYMQGGVRTLAYGTIPNGDNPFHFEQKSLAHWKGWFADDPLTDYTGKTKEALLKNAGLR